MLQVTREISADDRPLLRAVFRPHSPDPDKTAMVEVIFETKEAGRTILLNLVSATRTDTRESVFLTPEQRDAILEAANCSLADEDDSPLWEDD